MKSFSTSYFVTILLSLILFSGCNDLNFGDKASDWVVTEGKKYAKTLPVANYEAFWHKKMVSELSDLEMTLSGLDLLLGNIYNSTQNEIANTDLKKSLNLILERKNLYSEQIIKLIGIKKKIEDAKNIHKNLESLCSREYFDINRLSLAGTQDILHQFARVEDLINLQDPSHYTANLDAVKMGIAMANNFVNFRRKKKYDKQMERLTGAINYFNEKLIMPEGDLYNHSRQICEDNQNKHKEIILKHGEVLNQFFDYWMEVYRLTIFRLKQIDEVLQLIKSKMEEKNFELNSFQIKIQQELAENGVFAIFIDWKSYIIELKKKVHDECDPIKAGEILKEYQMMVDKYQSTLAEKLKDEKLKNLVEDLEPLFKEAEVYKKYVKLLQLKIERKKCE